MPDIRHDFPIAAPIARVFAGFAEPAGLDQWWTLSSEGRPAPGEIYRLDFGPGFDWRALVIRADPPRSLELRFTEADDDWIGSWVDVELEERDGNTWVRFAHRGWREPNEHYRISSFCWAMYLRILKRHLEHGETVPYQDRLSV